MYGVKDGVVNGDDVLIDLPPRTIVYYIVLNVLVVGVFLCSNADFNGRSKRETKG